MPNCVTTATAAGLTTTVLSVADVRSPDVVQLRFAHRILAALIAALDAHAGRLGLYRSEYVRRRLAQDAVTPGSPVSVQDLARFADVFADLSDPDVMSQAWK